MSYVCYSCGEKQRFTRTDRVYGTCNYTEDQTNEIRGENEEIIDTFNYDNFETHEQEYEGTDDYGSVECECDGHVEEVSEETWARWIDGLPVQEQENYDEDLDCFKDENEIIENGAISNLKDDLMNIKPKKFKIFKKKGNKKCDNCGLEYEKKYYICKECGGTLNDM